MCVQEMSKENNCSNLMGNNGNLNSRMTRENVKNSETQKIIGVKLARQMN